MCSANVGLLHEAIFFLLSSSLLSKVDAEHLDNFSIDPVRKKKKKARIKAERLFCFVLKNLQVARL